ncbi:cytochrome-c peroxidase [Flammeovirga sp. EKP202]|uniref:cytochrome-c peroxidase n=1 Tax=Flammeovirga sp. EKP202 TaxID=2770592 RepID=UPI00165EC0DD|nr:cytochrome c peroxidase [Flammeovirga sp. EKP202]MBD0404284.1 cytochrome-c peroxidase [Flammeovirga sp. EKP202]
MERYFLKIVPLIGITIFIGACLFSCEENRQASVISYQNIPAPEHNEMDPLKVELGRKLFFDPHLSKDSTVSCAHCHQPQYGFGENVSLSTQGVSHKPLLRNSPALINIAWASGWFWDGGAKNIESLIFGPLTHEDEMGTDLKLLISNINTSTYYKEEFKKAFGVDKVYSAHLARALAQYVRTLISNQSKYDSYLNGKYQFSVKESLGYKVYQEKCSSCHKEPFFTDFEYHNNGLDTTYSDQHEGINKGRGRITRVEEDILKYKTPTLRNLFATVPYMHDGRFNSINEVLDHYEKKIQITPTLDSALINGIHFEMSERENLIAFLETLMDSSFLELN